MIWSRKKGETFQFEVEGIHCTHCEATIKLAVRDVAGVQRVNIRRMKQVEVETDPEKHISREQLLAAIQNTGYTVH